MQSRSVSRETHESSQVFLLPFLLSSLLYEALSEYWKPRYLFEARFYLILGSLVYEALSVYWKLGYLFARLSKFTKNLNLQELPWNSFGIPGNPIAGRSCSHV